MGVRILIFEILAVQSADRSCVLCPCRFLQRHGKRQHVPVDRDRHGRQRIIANIFSSILLTGCSPRRGVMVFADKRMELGAHLRKMPMGYFTVRQHR